MDQGKNAIRFRQDFLSALFLAEELSMEANGLMEFAKAFRLDGDGGNPSFSRNRTEEGYTPQVITS
ncbi:hypothetical protein [Desulfosoma sp.]|uniref:hypothetical protein n=1 Tax=Desulfosoma sp. TaxID=2603217 RepID=UPI004049C956